MSFNQNQLKNAAQKISSIQNKNNISPVNGNEESEKIIIEKLHKLEKINSTILNALKNPSQNSQNIIFGDLLDQRLNLSAEIETLCNASPIEELNLSDECKVIIAKVLSQDKELMIYLELEVQKLQGKYKRLQLQAQQAN